LVRSQNDAFTNLVSMDAAARQQNRMLASQARSEMAGYKDKAFKINELDPYQNKLDAAQANIGSGIQNIFSALDMGAMLSSGMGGNRSMNMGDEDYENYTESAGDQVNRGLQEMIRRGMFLKGTK
jgi:hypothetical protein